VSAAMVLHCYIWTLSCPTLTVADTIDFCFVILEMKVLFVLKYKWYHSTQLAPECLERAFALQNKLSDSKILQTHQPGK